VKNDGTSVHSSHKRRESKHWERDKRDTVKQSGLESGCDLENRER
jgi:hypothetical protein